MLDLSNPGTAGLALLKEVTRPEWLRQPHASFSIFKQHKTVDLLWKTDQSALHLYDKRAMYVGAASSVKLGIGIPEYVAHPQIEDRAGVWRVIIDQSPAGFELLPPIVKSADSWQYTPIVELLRKLGYMFHAEEAWLFSEQHAVLRPFYERVKALWQATADNPDARRQVKRLYTITFGLLAHEKLGHGAGYVYRPDWTFSLVAEAKARMFYQMRKVLETEDVAPSQVKTDCIWYPRPVTALPVGDKIGQFKYKVVSAEGPD
jgi:hypothetical protein